MWTDTGDFFVTAQVGPVGSPRIDMSPPAAVAAKEEMVARQKQREAALSDRLLDVCVSCSMESMVLFRRSLPRLQASDLTLPSRVGRFVSLVP